MTVEYRRDRIRLRYYFRLFDCANSDGRDGGGGGRKSRACVTGFEFADFRPHVTRGKTHSTTRLEKKFAWDAAGGRVGDIGWVGTPRPRTFMTVAGVGVETGVRSKWVRWRGLNDDVRCVLLTVNRLHQTDSHLMSLMRFPAGSRSIMLELLCVCSGGGSLQNGKNNTMIVLHYKNSRAPDGMGGYTEVYTLHYTSRG